MAREPMFDSADIKRRKLLGWICDDKKCVWTNPNLNSKTPLLDSLSTEFPTVTSPVKRKSRLDNIPSLTTLLGGP